MVRAGAPERAWRSTCKALVSAPDRFRLYSRLAGALRATGRAGTADKALARARVLRPDEPRLLVNTANLWISTTQRGDPARALKRALCLDPGLAAALERLLLVEKALGDRPAAIRTAKRRLCQITNGGAAFRLELALLVFEAGDLACAVGYLKRSLPGIIGVDGGLRRLLDLARRAGGNDFSLRLARNILCLWPTSAEAAREFAAVTARDDAGWRHRDVLLAMRLAWPLDPVVWNCAGVFLEQRDCRAIALACYVKAAVLDPSLSIALFNTGVQARYRGDFQRAARWFERALVASPLDPVYSYNLGHVLLANGQWRQGLDHYEERWRSGERPSHRRAGSKPSFPQPFWDGQARGRSDDTVLVWGEQGVGDEIWFAGYISRVLANQPVVLECDRRLTPLFERSMPGRTIVARRDPAATPAMRAAWQVAAGSLPYLAKATQPDRVVPAPSGYLRADSARIEGLRRRLAGVAAGPTIGISWRSRKPRSDLSFEAPLDAWEPIFKLPGVTFVNLQYGVTAEELSAIRASRGIDLISFEDIDPLLDLDDLAALMMALDHVISIANVTVALCHGLGRSCDVALRHYQEDWRFQRGRDQSPWLPNCSFFWSTTPQSWGDVFTRIAENMRNDRCIG